ncbi:hypothetical protein DYBT9623_04377 [Dyadobacter sp. CECT 9623]|uniref:DUF4332 domain-containing protein n=1 Tax=Dyadobacter linearis TaxID=2823330 RepID=A0ABM8UVU0_9BACT|nr:hypothetical protein [Dyadobacter sp. CECT 9623]CAG5072836.1 hypothetical protein DYBT9623_04377 [Dyadobacter sp. CECT 9623]
MNQLSFPIESQSLAIAIGEIASLLFLSAILGWWLAKTIVKTRIRRMRILLEEKKYELTEFRTSMENNNHQPVATNASKTVYPVTSPDHAPDDLKRIDGIGPKIEELFNKEGIHTYEQLSETSVIRMVGILKKAGPRFQIQDPSSWPKQAELAKNQEWEELEQFIGKLASRKG